MTESIGKQSEAQKKASAASRARQRARSATGNFMTFVRQQGVVGLAVGLAIGTAAGASVKAIVDGFISPVVGFILGGVNLMSISWHTGWYNNGNQLIIGWGAVVNSIIVLLATALVVYIFVHGSHLDKLDKKKD